MFYALKIFFGQHYVTYLSVLLFLKTRSIEKIYFFKTLKVNYFS